MVTFATMKKIKKLVNNKTGVSQRKIANSLNINQSTVSRSIKKIGLKYKKCCRAPKATEAQKKRQSERLEKITDKFFYKLAFSRKLDFLRFLLYLRNEVRYRND